MGISFRELNLTPPEIVLQDLEMIIAEGEIEQWLQKKQPQPSGRIRQKSVT
jgi:hypothetical protein